MKTLRALPWALLSALCVVALYQSAILHGGFVFPCAGVRQIPPSELMFYVWYLVWGSLAWAFASWFLVACGLAEALRELARRALGKPETVVAIATAVAAIYAIAFRAAILQYEPVTDDEQTYDFIARTLLHGRVTNPLPLEEAFLRNQFVVFGEHGWYGKYPIGHPLLLALARVVGLRELIVPLVAAGSIWLSYAIGRRCFDATTAALACVLLAVSPQFLWTHATLLSQPTSGCALLLALYLTLRLRDEGSLALAVALGAVWAFAILVRPFPTILFAGVLWLFVLRRPLARSALVALGIALGVAGIAATNYAQSGNPLSSGYHATQGELGILFNEQGTIANSLGGALLRQNFWLFGWPLSFVFLPFARAPRLLWSVCLATLAYRVLVPKTVVSVTGPIYMAELVPLLALFSADGARRALALLSPLGVPRALASALIASGCVIALFAFVPPHLRTLVHGAAARRRVYDKLAELPADDREQLVFTETLVSPARLETWAYFPPNPSPTLDDSLLFLQLGDEPRPMQRAWQLWRARFPQRRAFIWRPEPDYLMELDPLRAPNEPP